MSWAPLSDVRLYFEATGSGDPLVLIPGLGATCRHWDPIAPSLAEHFSVIAFDQRGVGQSKPIRPANSLRDYSADIVELLDYLQIDRTHMLGLSLGGIVAQRFAIEHRSRLNRLVLMSCTHKFEPYLKEITKLLGVTLKGFSKEMFTRTMTILGSGPGYFDADPTRIDKALERAAAAGVPRTDVLRQLQCLVASEPETESDERHIDADTLVVAGQYDSVIPPYYGERMAEEIPNSQYVMLCGAGHNPLFECPDKVLLVVESFLSTGSVPDTEGIDSPRGRQQPRGAQSERSAEAKA